jgi:hypothetical protein
VQVMKPDQYAFKWIPRHPRNRRDPPHAQKGPLGVDCFSHFPQAHCFVQHYFAGELMKQQESRQVRDAVLYQLRDCARVRRLLPPAAATRLCAPGQQVPVGNPLSEPLGKNAEEALNKALELIAQAIHPFVDVVEIV